MKTTSEALKDFVEKEYQTSTVMRFNKHYRHYLEEPVDDKAIFMEVRDGHSFVGNVKAIYEALLKDDRFHDYHFYISYDSEDEKAAMQQWMTVTSRTHFVQRLTEPYAKALATSRYLFNNSTFIASFMKRDNQCYINTWHGTPLKHMGFDLKKLTANENTLRNFLMTDYLISPNEHTTNLFLDSYKLNGLYQGTIIENGYPRIDTILQSKKEQFLQDLHQLNISIDSHKKTILYTPTWKGNHVAKPQVDNNILKAELQYLKEHLPQYNILLKVHPFVYSIVKDDKSLMPYLIPDAYDINALLGHIDILLTDYSSVFFDFLVTKKPIIFYCPDNAQYQWERGLYFQDEELPGPIFECIQEVCEYIQSENFDNLTESYENMRLCMTPYDHGNVTSQYIDAIFFNKTKPLVCRRAKQKKKKVLLYAGGMNHNGITEALINLCWSLDEEVYDITLLMNNKLNNESEMNIRKLPPYVRPYYRVGYPLFTPEERYMDQVMIHQPSVEHHNIYYPQLQKAYHYETKRLFGTIKFDYAIDYSGYSYYWAKYILFVNATYHYIYLHNHMLNEQLTKEKHHINLQAIFLLYPYFDTLINVSDELMIENQEALQVYVPKSKHIAVKNLLAISNGQIEEISEDKFKDCYQRYRCDESIDVSCYNCHLIKFGTKTLLPTDNLAVMTKAIYQHQLYFHIYINNLPSFWINYHDLQRLTPIGESIVKKEKIKMIVKVKDNAKGSVLVYQTKKDIEQQNATGITRLKGYPLQVDEKIVTKDRNVFYNVHCGYWKGCVKHNQVTEYHLDYDDVEMDCTRALPTYSGAHHCMLQIKNSNASFYSALYGLASSHEKGTLQTLPSRLYSYWMMENNYGRFYQFKSIDGQTGWINERDVDIYHDFHIIDSIKHHTYHHILGKNVMVYTTKEAIKIHSAQVYDIDNDSVLCKEELWTSYGIFYYIETDEIKGYISEDFVQEGVKPGYIKDINGKWVRDFDNQHYHFITVGRLSHEKNHEALINGFATYFKQHPDKKATVDCYILGDGPLKETLMQQIHQENLDNNVFLLGYKSNVKDYLSKADHFIFPSKYEGQGLALIEALMQPMPVSVHNIPVLNCIVDNGNYGYLIENMEPDVLAEHIHKVINTTGEHRYFDESEYQKQVLKDLERRVFVGTSLWQKIGRRFWKKG